MTHPEKGKNVDDRKVQEAVAAHLNWMSAGDAYDEEPTVENRARLNVATKKLTEIQAGLTGAESASYTTELNNILASLMK